MPNKITIKKFKNDIKSSSFFEFYKNLMLDNVNKKFDDDELTVIFKLALMLINYGDKIVSKLGYRLILRYCNLTGDYIPLYDYAIASNFAPISKYIEENYNIEELSKTSFNSMFLSAYLENFRSHNIYLSKGQKEIVNFARKTLGHFVVIAPTSYGKSEIMINMIKHYKNRKVCIIVPTKALLSQTRKRILNEIKDINEYGRIIVHPDMYNDDNEFIAVLTQERLFRLLQKKPDLSLDLVLVDEAHSLLEDTSRSNLLAYILIISKKRNEGIDIRYFTPFLIDANNLKIPYINNELKSIRTNEELKIERYYYVYNNGKIGNVDLYDQFLDEFYLYKSFQNVSDIDIILRQSTRKNIIYLNKSRNLEYVAKKLAYMNKSIDKNDKLVEVCKNIADFLHKDYTLIKCLRKGVVYHHGTMPDLIRLYVEDVFRKIDDVRFIVSSSTLLEGVNIPAEKLFILENKKGPYNLTGSQFKNLIGRVCRFSDIFNREHGDISLLEPEIYVFDGEFTTKRSNIKKFIQQCAKEERKLKDLKANVMLKGKDEIDSMSEDDKEKLTKAIEYLENIEPNSIEKRSVKYAKYKVGKLCYINNISEFDIIKNEEILNLNLQYVNQNIKITTSSQLIETIVLLFLNDNIELFNKQENLKRLKNVKSQKFYSMLLDWRANGSSYKKMISRFVKYWRELEDKIVFVGSKWGEQKRSETDFIELYIDISNKTDEQLINLAILRIKEEQDFLDNSLMKFVEIINDLGLIEKSFYERIKYGSDNPYMICLLKNGYSIELARCVLQKDFERYVTIDTESDQVIIDSNIIKEMITMEINEILIFELKYHING